MPIAIRSKRAVCGLAVLGLLCATVSAPAEGARKKWCRGSHWVASWAASPSHASSVRLAPARQTLRMIVAPHLAGSTTRLRFSNRYRREPVVLARVTVGRRAVGAAVQPDTMRSVRFAGAEAVEIPPGADVYSDPVELAVEPFQALTISVFLDRAVESPTEHFITRQTSYSSGPGSGDLTGSEQGLGFAGTRTAWSNGWSFLTGIDVLARRRDRAVVAFGDSLTDGFQGEGNAGVESFDGVDADVRYPDFLQRRLGERRRRISVVNAGISGNGLRHDSSPDALIPGGAAGLARLRPDALEVAGVGGVVVLEGINDLGRGADAGEVIAALSQVVARVRARRLRAVLGTLPPTGGATGFGEYGTAEVNRKRIEVNAWIRAQRDAAVADFDAALRDPLDPARLAPKFDSSDHVHPSTAGFRAMADAVRLRSLRARCRAL